MILTTKYESKLKVTVSNGSEKLMSVKIHVLKKASVAKLYNGIHRYSAKRNIAILCLSAAALILKACILYSYSS